MAIDEGRLDGLPSQLPGPLAVVFGGGGHRHRRCDDGLCCEGGAL